MEREKSNLNPSRQVIWNLAWFFPNTTVSGPRVAGLARSFLKGK
jgi:hypothetical protein